jgi:hypothetical protein
VVITSASGAAVRLVALPQVVRAEPSSSATVIGHALDQFIGTWSPEQAAEVLQSIEVFEQSIPSRMPLSLPLPGGIEGHEGLGRGEAEPGV